MSLTPTRVERLLSSATSPCNGVLRGRLDLPVHRDEAVPNRPASSRMNSGTDGPDPAGQGGDQITNGDIRGEERKGVINSATRRLETLRRTWQPPPERDAARRRGAGGPRPTDGA